jgi:ribonuclease VapC
VIAVDTSILVGRIKQESDVQALDLPASMAIVAPALLEAHLWCGRNLASKRSHWLDTMLEQSRFRIDSFTPAMAELAGEALRRMGRGTGHPANLNFGDAMVYAHARQLGLTLLCKGNDFCHTELALHPKSIVLR